MTSMFGLNVSLVHARGGGMFNKPGWVATLVDREGNDVMVETQSIGEHALIGTADDQLTAVIDLAVNLGQRVVRNEVHV